MEKFDKYKVLVENYDHGLSAIGCVVYEYCKHNKTLNIYIDYDRHSKENIPFKILTGKEALDAYLNMQESVNNLTEESIINVACDVSKKTLSQLQKKTRKPEIVFARNLVFWAVNKYLKYPFSNTGALFGLDHATALRACKIIGTYEDKHLTEWQAYMRRKFIEKLNNLMSKGKVL